ncbi:hypothetical protein SteCoe_31253 [Stentor coeruleus]|uniref:Uncharacterized protein n=1 Tax=Stentor coeruleus TaxID=5963 RepID=A0A1R2B1Q2_9CILI|nr:hypothetical protein SteCoe_31253 [Stentor coeruleus]
MSFSSCGFPSESHPNNKKFEIGNLFQQPSKNTQIDFQQDFNSYFNGTSSELPKSMSIEPEVYKPQSKPLIFDKPSTDIKFDRKELDMQKLSAETKFERKEPEMHKTSTDIKFERKEPDLHKKNFRQSNLENPVEKNVKPAAENNAFKVPFKSLTKDENLVAKKFTLKRETISKPESESKKLISMQIPASPLPNIKSKPFTSAVRPQSNSKPLLKLQTPSIPSFISAEEFSVFISSAEEDKKLLLELEKTFDQLETLKNEETYESISDMLSLKNEIPLLTLRAVKIRYSQVVLMNKLLICDIPELKSLNQALANFDKEHNIC